MNTILQKRIEEAANTTVQNLYDYAKQTRNPKVSAYSEGYLNAIDVQGDFLFREGANYALSNQWISVEEALPKANELVFGCVNDEGVPQAVGMVYCDEYGGWHYSDEEEISLITNWMPIPILEGGEK